MDFPLQNFYIWSLQNAMTASSYYVFQGMSKKPYVLGAFHHAYIACIYYVQYLAYKHGIYSECTDLYGLMLALENIGFFDMEIIPDYIRNNYEWLQDLHDTTNSKDIMNHYGQVTDLLKFVCSLFEIEWVDHSYNCRIFRGAMFYTHDTVLVKYMNSVRIDPEEINSFAIQE